MLADAAPVAEYLSVASLRTLKRMRQQYDKERDRTGRFAMRDLKCESFPPIECAFRGTGRRLAPESGWLPLGSVRPSGAKRRVAVSTDIRVPLRALPVALGFNCD